MRIETLEVKVYSVKDIMSNPSLLDKVLENHRHINVEHDWWDCNYDDFVEYNNDCFHIDRMYFSGFYSQGDGAMFEYSSVNDKLRDMFIDTLDLTPMRKSWLRNNIAVSGNGKQRGHYYHSSSCTHNIYWEVDNGDLHYTTTLHQWMQSYEGEFEDFVIQYYKSLCNNLYRGLEETYNYLTSDEQVLETLECNDYEFTEDGNIY